MGIRKAFARCFGRGPSRARTIGEKVAGLIRQDEKLLPSKGGLIHAGSFNPDLWSQQILKNYTSSLGLADIFKAPEEKVCPLTKQLVIEQLRDMAAASPGSIRAILSAVFQDGIRDDYELLDRLEHFNNPSESKARKRVVAGSVP